MTITQPWIWRAGTQMGVNLIRAFGKKEVYGPKNLK